MSDERHEAISRRAYELWEREGGEHGRHDEHWHRAAREVEGNVTVTAPDGSTLLIPTASEVLGEVTGDAHKPADTPAAKPASTRPPRAPKAAAEPADSPATATPGTPIKTSAKPRKPKAK